MSHQQRRSPLLFCWLEQRKEKDNLSNCDKNPVEASQKKKKKLSLNLIAGIATSFV